MIDHNLSNSCRYIGIDLAWSTRNRSGGATLYGGPGGAQLVEDPQLLGDDTEIIAYIDRHAATGPAMIAVDAPLVVPNEHGRRPADALLSAAFRRYEAGAHPANRRLLARNGIVRGEALVAALAERGFRYVTEIEAGANDRLVCEMFPHPAMVAIFGLARTLKYKPKPRRSREVQLAEWLRYQDLLRSLTTADPPLFGQHEFLDVDPAVLRPSRLKAYEDRVDALFCAYMALYAQRWGAARCRTFGDLTSGAIFTPVPEEMR